MSGRSDLAAMFQDVLPDTWSVIDHDATPVLARMTVMTYVERVEAGVTRAFRLYRVIAIVMSPKQSGADGELEDAMEEVLEAIDLWDYPCVWTEAEYATYNDQYPCYKVTTEMHVRREYGDVPVDNVGPNADFTYGHNGLHTGVDASISSDSDGTITAYDWDWGDGATSTGLTSDHLYGLPGTYVITLTVTDDKGATDSREHDLTVP